MRTVLASLLSAVLVIPAAATEPPPVHLPPEGLRWTFDDGLKESSPLHLVGVAQGPVTFADSPLGGKALVLDGKTARVSGPRANRLDLAGQPFTVAAWIKADHAKQAGIVCLGGYSWRHGWLLDMHPDGSLRLELSAPEGQHLDTLLSGSGVIKPGRWTHVAAVVNAGRNSGPSRLYVNGFEVARKLLKRANIVNPQAVLTIGGIENAVWANFPGQVDEVRLFARALAAGEVAALVEPGKPFATRPRPGPVNWDRIAPWAVITNPLDRFADPLPAPPRVPFANGKFALRPGEVVVFTGPANVVFEQQQGWLETLLAKAASTQQPVFRHMSWEGDTVYEQSRAMNFGGWGEQLDAVGVSTIVAWFGQVEALDDTKTVNDFAAAYGKLLDEFQKTTPRLVVIAPPPFEKPAGKWAPDNTRRNARVREFAAVARRLATERGAMFVDLFTPLAARGTGQPRLTEDGMHFTPEGQCIVAEVIARQLSISISFAPPLEPLRRAIVTKNRLWFDCWRTMNWYFSYGDRTFTAFDKPAAGRPSLAKELEQYKPELRTADALVHALALGRQPPPSHAHKPLPAQPLHPPEEELKSFKLRDGYDVNLFASEADGLVKPIQIQWDERGRLWALCVPSYPQLVPGVPADDYILVCEDTDGDGRADKFTKFATGLVMPTGFALGDGGVYVCEATQLIHLRDTDGDGKADQRRVIYSGFGTGDSHQMINSLCWGPDGRLWFTQGLHIFSTVETPWGLARCGKTAVWRMNPRTLQLHHFLGNAAASENAWGVGFDDWGQTFYGPGNDHVAFYIDPALVPLPVEQLTYGQFHDIGMLAPSKTKAMRAEFIGTRHLPADVQGALVKSVYYGNYVELHRLKDNGAGFSSELIGPLISSSSDVFRPLEAKVGPDGAIYICDWCNPVIGHYQASYRDPRRDHTHGRVWRVTARGRPTVKPPALAAMDATPLLDQLRSPERWVRDQAKRLLATRPGTEVIPAADAWLAKTLAATDAAGAAPLLFEVTGVYAAHEEVRPELLGRLLDSPEPRLRAFGAHMLGLWADRLPDPLALLDRMAADDCARVRMEAAVAAAYVQSPAAVEVATRVLDKPRDRFIDYALTQTVRALKAQWYPALARGGLYFNHQPDRLRFVLEADGTRDVAAYVRKLAGTTGLDEAARNGLLALLASVGGAGNLRFALEQGRHSALVLGELATAAQVRRQVPAGDLAAPLEAILADRDEAVRAAGLRLAGVWKVKPLAEAVRAQLQQTGASELVTRAAVEALAALDGREAIPVLMRFASERQPPGVRASAVAALGQVDLGLGAKLAAGLMVRVKDEAQMADLLLPFLARKGGSEALAKALADVKLLPDPAKLAHRVLSAAGREDAALLATLNQALGLSSRKIAYSPELVKQLAAEARSQGDGKRGRAVFTSKLANCTACHRIGGQGGDVGPDLSSVGTGLTVDLIVESILWPNRQVKEGYMATRVTTVDGRILTGYKVKETPAEIQLRDPATRKVHRIARKDIDGMADAGSLMPEMLAATLTREELRDLVRYLSELGRKP
jgi:putative heme-binding domain-containing protein